MTPITMTKNSEVADYGSVPSSPGDDGETMHLIQKQVDEGTTMAKEVKRNSLLSASLLIGAAALFFAGYAFSLSVSTQMQSELPVLGDWYHIGWHPIGYWPDYVPKDELATFCNFESFDIDSPDFASHPCARCYLIGLFEPYGDQDIRHDTSYAEGRLDFAKCYFKGIKDQGREPSKADYTMKPRILIGTTLPCLSLPRMGLITMRRIALMITFSGMLILVLREKTGVTWVINDLHTHGVLRIEGTCL